MASTLRLSAVLFDLDGTLIATRRLYVEALAEALEPVVGSRLTEADIMAYRPKAERRFLRELAGDAVDEVLELFYRAYHSGHERHFQGIYEGVADLLAALRARHVPMGIVTGKSRRAWRITEPLVQLGDFHVVVLDDDVPHPKPDPTGLRIAARRLGADPAEVIYVGDSLTDLEAARAAEMRAGGVLWSKRPHEVEPFREASLARGALTLEAPEDLLRLVEG
jgi:pyrophosphatase PpaX